MAFRLSILKVVWNSIEQFFGAYKLYGTCRTNFLPAIYGTEFVK